MKKIGVVIPIFNTEQYLKRCIDSIVCQTGLDYEVVLVDDGSTDGSAIICNEYVTKYQQIKYIYQENKGKLAARFEGVKACDSDYITFVDSDDWLAPCAFEQVSRYAKVANSVIVYQIVRWYNEDYYFKSKLYYPSGRFEGDELRRIKENMIWNVENDTYGVEPSLCNKLFPYDQIYQELEKAQTINVGYGDDVAIIYPLLTHTDSIIVINEPLYFHRQRKEGNIADYIRDDMFFLKLSSLYKYLAERFESNPKYVKQLDYFFVHSVKHRLKLYDDSVSKNRIKYLFPFDKVKQNSRVVVYGAGEKGKEYIDQIKRTDYVKVVGWVDKNYKEKKGIGVISPRAISEMSIEYLVVAVSQKEIADQIIDNLKEVIPDGCVVVWSE